MIGFKFSKLILVFLAPFIVIILLFLFICVMTYSDVSRSGVLTKISRKGYIFKTYEGDLNIGGFNDGNGTIMPNSIFKFSVHDQPTYKKSEELQVKRFVISYEQVIKIFSEKEKKVILLSMLKN
jgi:hypothetical protein